MSYDWNEQAEKDGRGPKIPVGRHELRIEEVVYEKKSGPFISSKGDPQILVILRDKQEREAGSMYTLSAAAGWSLAKLLKACHPVVNLAKMQADGIEPKHFANPDFADSVLLGRQLLCDVQYEKGSDGKEYPRVAPLCDPVFRPSQFPTVLKDEERQPAAARAAASAPATGWMSPAGQPPAGSTFDDIPF